MTGVKRRNDLVPDGHPRSVETSHRNFCLEDTVRNHVASPDDRPWGEEQGQGNGASDGQENAANKALGTKIRESGEEINHI